MSCRRGVNKDGQLGNAASSDFVSTGQLNALLEFVHHKLGEIGDQIMSGKVEVKPYRIGKVTPCPPVSTAPSAGSSRAGRLPASHTGRSHGAPSFITATVKGRADAT